jgi:Zn-dependent protease
MAFPLWLVMIFGCFAFSIIMGIVVHFLQVRNIQGLDDEARSEFQAIQTGKKSKLSKLLILMVSLILFALVSKVWFGWHGIAVLIVVLLIHELGHFLGMKTLGYKDPYIFFIPVIGAAVAGTATASKGSHKAIISLLGPLPGIIIGILFGVMYLSFHKFIFLVIWSIFLLVNGSNLLPFFPLDGGRFFDAILFARNRTIEMVFKTAPAIVLLGIAVYLHQWWLGIFVLLILISLPAQFKIISVANEMIQSRHSSGQIDKWELSDEILNNILSRLRGKLRIQKPKQLAKFAHMVWQKINFEPPSMDETIILIFTYVIFLSAAVFSSYVTFSNIYNKKIETFQGENGVIGIRELAYFGDFLLTSYEVSENNLYHGKAVHYMLDKVVWKGQYYEGQQDGEWTHYDMKGNTDRIVYFDKGRFITGKRLTSAGWKELSWDDLPERDKAHYLKHEHGIPQGPIIGVSETSKP